MAKKQEERPESPLMRYFGNLKRSHKDAILLFRCGDFYETYYEDAYTVSQVLGITLTRRNGNGYYMAGFPYHALDAYLPKLIRAGHRVAICDTPPSDDPTPTNNRNNNPQTTENNMKLNLSKTNNESANVANNAQVSNAIEPIKVAAGSVPMTPEAFLAEREDIVDADFEEVKEEASAPIAEEKPKKKVTIKRKVTLKKKQAEPIAEQPQESITPNPSPLTLPQVTFGTYKTKKGDTAPQIIGFAGEDDPRWKAHKDAGHKYVSASYRRDLNGNKVYILLFGVRYMDVAKALAGAYNTADVDAWHRAEDACMAIYEQAQRDGKAKWEEKKAAWAEKKAEQKAASKREQSGAGSDSAEREQVRPEVNAAKEQAKCYKPEDVAAMLTSMLNGGDLPEEIKRLMKAA